MRPAAGAAGRGFGVRGLTLIEMAIALVVIGLVLGAAIIPLRTLEQDRRYDEETRRMEMLRDAVVGYAARNRTRGNTEMVMLEGANFMPVPRVFSSTPAGRPYLPCPDTDGDGLEDRDGYTDAGSEDVTDPVTLVIRITLADAGGNLYRPVADIEVPGDCETSRGLIPWRTLGVPAADRWGGRHTYYVDPLFASASRGFDRNTFSNIYDQRIPSSNDGNVLPPLRAELQFPTGLGMETDRQCPGIICSGGRAADGDDDPESCALALHREMPDATDPRMRCGWEVMSKADAPVVKAGVLAPYDENAPMPLEGIEIGVGERQPPGVVLEGVPFIIVSHGENGRGAVNHWRTLSEGKIYCNPFPSEEADSFDFVSEPRDWHEAMNASRFVGGQGSSDRRCPPLKVGANKSDALDLDPAFFVWEPPNAGAGDREFDDILIWMTREELTRAMERGIPPAPAPVFIPTNIQ